MKIVSKKFKLLMLVFTLLFYSSNTQAIWYGSIITPSGYFVTGSSISGTHADDTDIDVVTVVVVLCSTYGSIYGVNCNYDYNIFQNAFPGVVVVASATIPVWTTPDLYIADGTHLWFDINGNQMTTNSTAVWVY